MKRVLAILLLTLGMVSIAATAQAQSRPSVFFQPGFSTNRFTGDVGRFASASVGFGATQGIRFGLFGGYLSLSSDFHLTNQPPPPYARGLRTFTVAAGLRITPDIRPIQPIFSFEYANLGVVSNALIRYTGPRQSFNAVGVGAGARMRFLGPFHVEAHLQSRYFFDMNSPTFSIGGTIALGVSGGL